VDKFSCGYFVDVVRDVIFIVEFWTEAIAFWFIGCGIVYVHVDNIGDMFIDW
jgi:hypothetical protein